jgi:DNA polymerase III epsilon subunit-like protein
MKDEPSLCFARIVQLGWSISKAHVAAAAETKVYLVKPDGFDVTPRATQFHKITHERAQAEGRPLTEVLQEFMCDVKGAYASGGRLVAHQIEFDYRVIYEELGRSRLTTLQEEWKSMGRQGYCTMNPIAGRWLLESAGQEVGPPTAKHTLRLGTMLRLLLPDDTGILQKKHDAGADAQMTRLVYIALFARSRPWTERQQAPG